MTPNRFKIVRGRGPGEMDLIRSFLTFRLALNQQVPVSIEIGPQQEEGFLYVSGLRHQDGRRDYQFWGELFIIFADRENHPRNRFEVVGYYDSHQRGGDFSIEPLTPYRLAYVDNDQPDWRGFFTSFGRYSAGVSDSLLEEIKEGHWVWEEPSNMRYYFEHLEFTDSDIAMIDPSLGVWRPIAEIRVSGDEENPQLEIINL